MCVVDNRASLKALDTSIEKEAFLNEDGRSGQFIWKTGDYSAKCAADPLEGIFIASDSTPATSGAWVRQAGFFISGFDIRWFGAVKSSNPYDTTRAIQHCMNLCAFLGGGKTVIPAGEWLLSETQTETHLTSAMPNGMQDHYALLVPSGVLLEGEGFLSRLKRGVPDPLVLVLLANCTGAKVANINIDGNHSQFPITGETYGSGAGIIVESFSSTEDRTNTLDTIWINDTPGYGIGAGWGHRRGLTIKNIFINGTGSDGIDLKRCNSGAFDAFGVVIDNVTVENFGRTATDGAQTGVDIRGYVTASNIHVRHYGAKARAGIRLRGGIEADGVIGGHRSTLTNYRVERISGGEATTFALEVNTDGVSTTNGSVEGCTINVMHLAIGKATSMIDVVHTGVHSFNAGSVGFRTRPEGNGVRFIGCSDYRSPTGFYLEGKNNKLISPYITGAGGLGINIRPTASNTAIIQPTYTGTITPIQNDGTGTVIL